MARISLVAASRFELNLVEQVKRWARVVDEEKWIETREETPLSAIALTPAIVRVLDELAVLFAGTDEIIPPRPRRLRS